MLTVWQRRQRALGILAAAGLGTTFVVASVAGSGDADRLAHAREHLALCQVQRDTAVTEDEIGRAAQCADDWARIVKSLEPTPPPTPEPTTTTTSGVERFPTATSVGVPDGWTPKTVLTADLTIRSARTVEDTRVEGDVFIQHPGVTLRRVEVIGGRIHLSLTACRGAKQADGTMQYPLIEDTSVRAFNLTTDRDPPSVGDGGYTARRVAIDGTSEGFRAGGVDEGCGPVVIEDSYARVWSPDRCSDWHGDAIQGYYGPPLTVRHTTVELEEDGCPGNAPFFVPHSQGNTTVNVDGLLVKGGGFPFRDGVPGTVRGLRVVDQSWGYGPVNVKCSVVTAWEASIVRVDVDNTITATVRTLPCDMDDGK